MPKLIREYTIERTMFLDGGPLVSESLIIHTAHHAAGAAHAHFSGRGVPSTLSIAGAQAVISEWQQQGRNIVFVDRADLASAEAS